MLKDTALADLTPHVLRHSFSSVANDLGFTEATIGALMGHSSGTVTGRYIHAVDALLIMAADSVAGHIQGLLDGKIFRRTTYALDRESREVALARLFEQSDVNNNQNEKRIARRALMAAVRTVLFGSLFFSAGPLRPTSAPVIVLQSLSAGGGGDESS